MLVFSLINRARLLVIEQQSYACITSDIVLVNTIEDDSFALLLRDINFHLQHYWSRKYFFNILL